MKKLQIKNILAFILIACIFTFNFMTIHYALDTYFTANSGYNNYITIFAKGGRLVSALSWKIADILKIPFNVFITFGGVLSAVLCGITLYVITKKLNELLNKKNEKNKYILLGIVSILFVFNCMLLQNFVYAENFVMMLGLYICIKSANMIDTEKSVVKENIIPAILLLLATCCYQGILNVYLTFTAIIIFINYNNDIKKMITKFIKACINYVFALGTNFVILKLINKLILINESTRVEGNLDLLYNISYPFRMLKTIFLDTAGMMPKFLFGSLVVVSMAVLIYVIIKNKVKPLNVMMSLLILLVAYFSCFIPMMALSKDSLDAAARLLFSIGTLPAIILIISIFLNKDIKFEKIIFVVASLFVVINLVNYINVSKEHLVTNRKDIEETKKIYNLIKEYEIKNNITVDTVISGTDKNPKYYYDENRTKNELTVRANYINFIETAVLNMVSNKDYKYKLMSEIEKEKYFKNKEYDQFSEAQIIFDKNVMYWYKY